MRVRRTRPILFALLLVPFVLVGCGDDGGEAEGPLGKDSSCNIVSSPGVVRLMSLDLDGHGGREDLSYVPPQAGCAEGVAAAVGDGRFFVELHSGVSGAPSSAYAIHVPSRIGDIAVIRQDHPRGGFQVSLVGWVGGTLGLLESADRPLFPFVATDTSSTPLSASCTDDGFEITVAKAHQPIGVAPAWDVERTTYAVDGKAVTKGATSEVADNVLDRQLRTKYSDLVHHRLFENCRVGS
jgi:hypothetical protein